MKKIELQMSSLVDTGDRFVQTYASVEPSGRWKIVVTNGVADLYLEIKKLRWLIAQRGIWVHENQLRIQTIEEYINGVSE